MTKLEVLEIFYYEDRSPESPFHVRKLAVESCSLEERSHETVEFVDALGTAGHAYPYMRAIQGTAAILPLNAGQHYTSEP